MSDQQTIESSEECLLDRHGSCSGDVLVADTSLIKVRVPCLCICHEKRDV
jgi:hypothetical protein